MNGRPDSVLANQRASDEWLFDYLGLHPDLRVFTSMGVISFETRPRESHAVVNVELRALVPIDVLVAATDMAYGRPTPPPRPRVYVAGHMSGIEDFNRPAFHAAEDQLRAAGFDVLNPAHTRLGDDASWLDYMRHAIRMVSRADGLALLPGWEDSRGATVEHDLALNLGLPRNTLEHLVTNGPGGTP